MRSAIPRFSLGISLIALIAAVLLFSDWHQRKFSGSKIPRLALVQYSSQAVLEEGLRGILDGLAGNGWIEGKKVSIRRFNADGDLTVANAIAGQIVAEGYDLVVTVSTPSLQTVARANEYGGARHVFGLVADPYGAGVGIGRSGPLDHPKHLVGIPTLLPVADSFRLAKKLLPTLSSVGVVWNPAESNSELSTRQARAISRELGITLQEANADSPVLVSEAANALAAHGVQAIWVGGDNTVLVALDSVLAAARKARIPVFSVVPAEPDRGTLFDLGTNFYEAGKMTGELAAEILAGADPAILPISERVPQKLVVNRRVLAGLKEAWTVPEEIIARADAVVDETGVRRKGVADLATPQGNVARSLAKKWKIHIIEYIATVDTEEGEKGVLAGLRDAGLAEGRDYEVNIRNAQGDMATLSTLVDAAVTDGADLLIAITTPALQAALRRGKGTPIVFSVVSDAIAAGAGRKDDDHLPNVTGVHYKGAYLEMLRLIRENFPPIRVLGTLFAPAEVNMVREKDRLLEAAKQTGIEIVTLAVNSSADVADAALSLVSRKIDAICNLPGNLTSAGFRSIIAPARNRKIPIFAFHSAQAHQGAIVALARDYFDSGREAGLVAARVMRGEDPGKIPFQAHSKNKLMVNLEAARAIGFAVPPAVVKKAEEIIGN